MVGVGQAPLEARNDQDCGTERGSAGLNSAQFGLTSGLTPGFRRPSKTPTRYRQMA